MTNPFFSIVLCTRNRPELVENVLFSLRNQKFHDFEVILSDNSDSPFREKNRVLSKKYFFDGLNCIETKHVLSMHDHYNFAVEYALGEYVGVITDKSLLRKNALHNLYEILSKERFDILNYQHTGCLWYPKNFWQWISSNNKTTENPELEIYSPKEELERRFSLHINRAHSGKYYNFGKIFFGFYHKSLIQKIKKTYGEIFHPLSPDYTSTVLALSLSSKTAYFSKKIMFCINNYMGTGATGATQPGATKKFIESCGKDFEETIANLSIPNIYTAHNLCAYDYQILNRFGLNEYKLDLNNLAKRINEDMKNFPYDSQDHREHFKIYFENFCNENNIDPIIEDSSSIYKLYNQKSLLVSFLDFCKKNKKGKKLKDRLKSFWSTHHKTLDDLLNE